MRSNVFSSPAGPPLFAFDLDGTVTTRELLPCLAEHLGLGEEMRELTRRTLAGEIPFAASFRRRFAMLRDLPLGRVRESVAAVPLDPHIEAFIRARREDCAIVTGNLDLWILPLKERLPCRWFSSRGAIRRGRPTLLSVLDKGRVMDELAREGRPIVAVGESVNDLPMFARASLGIAFAGVHAPAPALQRLADRTVDDGASLCVLLGGFAEQGFACPDGGARAVGTLLQSAQKSKPQGAPSRRPARCRGRHPRPNPCRASASFRRKKPGKDRTPPERKRHDPERACDFIGLRDTM
jgi:HAD superfamily phosphoserine phosphatase-like hydrolase